MTPRERFRTDKAAIRRHLDLVDDSFLEHTFEIALSDMVWRQSSGSAPDGFRQHEQIEGAKEFIRTWRELSKPSERRPPSITDGGLLNEDEEVPLKP